MIKKKQLSDSAIRILAESNPGDIGIYQLDGLRLVPIFSSDGLAGLSGMDGIEACGRIRALDRQDAKCVPIAAMTADAFAEDIQKCLDAGMNAHIAKPVHPEVFFDVLGRLTAERS